MTLRIVCWNLNHRAARRRIATWVVDELVEQRPDVIVLTEYVAGADHEMFLASLAEAGLAHHAVTERVGRGNQLLITAREQIQVRTAPFGELHPQVNANLLRVTLRKSQLELIGFRMPAFTGSDRPRKREAFDHLLHDLEDLRTRRGVIVGDFNTAVGDHERFCGDVLDLFPDHGWRRGSPTVGGSWRSKDGTERAIDHVFHTAGVTLDEAAYDWSFQDRHPDAARGDVGFPDHAVLRFVVLPVDASSYRPA